MSSHSSAACTVTEETSSTTFMSAVDTEETPLLATQHVSVYSRFSPQTKKITVAIISLVGLLPPLALATSLFLFLHENFHSPSPINISWAIAISAAGTAVGALCWASLAGFYGRRVTYLVSLPLAILGLLGVASVINIPWFISCLFIQAFGSSGSIPLGFGVIADIYKLEERGTPMGVFLGATLLGPVLAVSGIAQNVSLRIMLLALGIAALVAFILVYAFLPETSQPDSLGLDILNKRLIEAGAPPRRVVLVNPLLCLGLLASPNLFSVILAEALVLLTDHMLLLLIVFTIHIGQRDSYSFIRASGLPLSHSIGKLMGAPFAGWLSDKVIIRTQRQRGGVWFPEDRLRVALPGALIFAPISVLAFRLSVGLVEGTIGLALAFMLSFFNGFGVYLVLTPAASYATDIFHSKSAEVIAASMGVQYLLLNIMTMCIPSLFHTFGMTATTAIVAGLAWLGFLALWVTIVYGDKLRAWMDMGYSTTETN